MAQWIPKLEKIPVKPGIEFCLRKFPFRFISAGSDERPGGPKYM
jgi:hypothetical protein